MPNYSPSHFKNSIAVFGGILTFFISLAAYLRTLASTVSLWDCGEFISCAYILGIPHPPGAPLYLLLGRLFTMLPLGGEIAWRVNLISALASATTVWLTYLIILQLIRACKRETAAWLEAAAAFVGALALAFSDSFWFNAVEAEVYALSTCLTALVIWLALRWAYTPETRSPLRYLVLIAYLIALAVGVHLLNVLTIPALLLLIYFKTRPWPWFKWLMLFALLALAASLLFTDILESIAALAPVAKLGGGFALLAALLMLIVAAYRQTGNLPRLLFTVLFLLGLGYSTYVTVLLRSNLDPAIDENDPQNWPQLVSYLNREQYGREDLVAQLTQRKASFWDYQIKEMYLRYFNWQFFGRSGNPEWQRVTLQWQGLWGLPFLLGCAGLIYHVRRDWRGASIVGVLFVMTGLAIVIYLNQTEGQPRERDYAYAGSYLAFAIWIGMGAQALFEKAASAQYRSTIVQLGLASLLILAGPVNLFQHNFHRHDRKGNYVAADYAYNLLSTCAPEAILFTNGDNDTFPLWYLQYVEGFRRDVSIVNLSLLNTPWYVRQLQRRPPKVPIALRSSDIDSLGLWPWPEPQIIRIPLTNPQVVEEYFALAHEVTTDDSAAAAPPAMQLIVGPTFQGRFLRPQDRMIFEIVSANQFQRPIYFGFNVPDENLAGLQPYLCTEGMARKLLPAPGQNEAPEVIKKNILQVYRYRNLEHPKVYLDQYETGLAESYRHHFLKLVVYELQRNTRAEALALLQKLEQIMPERKFPVRNFDSALVLARYYWQAGDSAGVQERLQQAQRRRGLAPEQRLDIAKFYWHLLRDSVHANEVLAQILDKTPSFQPALALLAEIQNAPSANQAVKPN